MSNAYSSDLFTEKVPDEFLCNICHDVPVHPKQCKSGHVFCDVCIIQWLQTHKDCPCDRSALTVESLSDCLIAKP